MSSPTTKSKSLITKTSHLHLYSAPLSGCSARVRISAHLKKIPNLTYHNLDLSTSEQKSSQYLKINPSGSVPALIIENENENENEQDHPKEITTITQSSAILDLLESYYPHPNLFPSTSTDPLRRARVMEFVSLVSCDIQPPQSISVRRKIKEDLKGDGDVWARWVYERGLTVYEELLARREESVRGPFSVGDAVTLADCFLVPVVQGAQRVGIRIFGPEGIERWPLVRGVVERCWEMEEFRRGGLNGESWTWEDGSSDGGC